MRNIDEIIQDIPLDELLNGLPENSETISGEITQRKSVPEPVQLKSRMPVFIAAACAALILGAGILFLASRTARVEPKSGTESLEAEPIYIKPDPNDSAIVVIPKGTVLKNFTELDGNDKAGLLCNAMETYLKNHAADENREYLGGEMYLNFSSPGTAEKQSTVNEFKLITGYDLTGCACFCFDDLRVDFAEWTAEPGTKVYCCINSSDKSEYSFEEVSELGRYPEQYLDICGSRCEIGGAGQSFGTVRFTQHKFEADDRKELPRQECDDLIDICTEMYLSLGGVGTEKIAYPTGTLGVSFVRFGTLVTVCEVSNGSDTFTVNGQEVKSPETAEMFAKYREKLNKI
ncbi:MAG: hypothetical protein IKP47_05705 [Ruminococcus sp.]|nr:hypothetical protein [Ruminococcus sp.]